ncbi:hypothetical protein L2E82_17198 [Cichorium intybus]|uniref:Uncharacterized protein n=1 Tax=Cichorium intybus TaxID=13427 RepID=A0ACB9F8W9_CICIN|nr:hypothetical protein L2E82_17198 [Cichorium intybus]
MGEQHRSLVSVPQSEHEVHGGFEVGDSSEDTIQRQRCISPPPPLMLPFGKKICTWKIGTSISRLSSIYTVAMKATCTSRRVFQLLDRLSSMPESGKKCPIKDSSTQKHTHG